MLLKFDLHIALCVHYATFIHAKTDKDTNKFLNLQIILHFLEKNVEFVHFLTKLGKSRGNGGKKMQKFSTMRGTGWVNNYFLGQPLSTITNNLRTSCLGATIIDN